MINCLEINQTVNELLIAFDDCNKIKNSDLRKLVELVQAVSVCANGGIHYDTEITESYEPTTDLVVIYPVNTYHSISVLVLEGNITQLINGNIYTFPTKTVLNTELTTLNQTEFKFTVKAGSKIIVKYLIPTI